MKIINGVAEIKSTYTKDDRCAMIPTDIFDNDEVNQIKVWNNKGTRYYLIDKAECKKYYDDNTFSCLMFNGQECISEYGHPRIPGTGYAGYFDYKLTKSFR